jgi:antitoxin YefM
MLRYVLFSVHASKNLIAMNAITYTSARANLATTMNRVCNDHEAIIITRNSEQSVVMLSLDDYQTLEETAYLLRSPSNAKRLLRAIWQLNNKTGIKHDLIEVEEPELATA